MTGLMLALALLPMQQSEDERQFMAMVDPSTRPAAQAYFDNRKRDCEGAGGRWVQRKDTWPMCASASATAQAPSIDGRVTTCTCDDTTVDDDDRVDCRMQGEHPGVQLHWVTEKLNRRDKAVLRRTGPTHRTSASWYADGKGSVEVFLTYFLQGAREETRHSCAVITIK